MADTLRAQLARLPLELVDFIVEWAGVKECALRGVLTRYIRAGNYSATYERQTLIEFDLYAFFGDVTDLPGIIVSNEATKRLTTWSGEWHTLCAALLYNRITLGVPVDDLLAWFAQRLPTFAVYVGHVLIRQRGSIEQLRDVCIKLGNYVDDRYLAKDFMAIAAQHRRADMVRYFDAQYPEWAADHRTVVEQAARGGSVDIVRYLRERAPHLLECNLLAAAARAGQEAVVRFVYELRPGYVTVDVAVHLVRHGMPQLLQLMYEQKHLSLLYQHRAPGERLQLAREAMMSDQLPVLQWLCSCDNLAEWLAEKLGVSLHSYGPHPDHINGFALRADIKVVRWIDQHSHLRCDDQSLLSAVRGRHLDLAKLIVARHPDAKFTEEVLVTACQSGNLALVKWAYGNLPATIRPASAIDWAAKTGHMKIVEWLHCTTSLPATHVAMDMKDALTKQPCPQLVKGRLEVLEFLLKHRLLVCTPHVITAAAQNVSVHTVQWLLSRYADHLTSLAIDLAVEWSNIHVVRFFHSLPGAPFTTNAMDWAIMSGDLDLVRWLHQNRKRYTETVLGTKLGE
ncbi:hypothetical protein RI367_007013 [Sorochytrium milnesiophthora]